MKKLALLLFSALLLTAYSDLPGWAETPADEGTGNYFDDSVITAKVKSAILNDSDLKVSDISVKTSKGVVRLRGYVTSQVKVNEAIKDSIGVAGVKSVKNELQIKNQSHENATKPSQAQSGY